MIINVKNLVGSVTNGRRNLLLYLFLCKAEEHQDKSLNDAINNDKEFKFIAAMLYITNENQAYKILEEANKIF